MVRTTFLFAGSYEFRGCHEGTYKQQMSVDSIIICKVQDWATENSLPNLGLSYVCGLVRELLVLF